MKNSMLNHSVFSNMQWGVSARSYEWNGADLLYSDLADAGIYRICDVGRTSCRIFSGEESDEIKSAGSDQALENCCQFKVE